MKFGVFSFWLFLVLLSINCFGQSYDSTYGKPLVVYELYYSTPTNIPRGPSFALYEKGQVIYSYYHQKKYHFKEATLSKDELGKVIETLQISDSIYQLENKVGCMTDGIEVAMTLNIRKPKTILIDMFCGDSIPEVFWRVCGNIRHYRNPDAVDWVPKKVRVLFMNCNNKKIVRPWPKGFPDFKSPNSNPIDDFMYEVYIDRSQFKKFNRFFSSLGKRQAVQINGRKMSIWYQFPLPNVTRD